ncbi:MAG: TPM domain-containing protein [Flavobacteriaceae bacterium]|nr:TPM domain-containing protein [Flavobacteriaceae bacterium]
MPDSKVEAFLSPEDELEIVEAIRKSELMTSGEIRVHLEAHSDTAAFERAGQVFHGLKMDHTRERNGVLFYVAVEDHKFAIYGDTGIDKVVPEGFWNEIKDTIERHFKKKQFKDGLIKGILMAGKALQEHFPWNNDDTNELSNEVSKS